MGKPIGLVGHGRRERQVAGPLGPGEPPRLVVIAVRRYRCRPCGALITVAPRGVVARRHYGAAAIGLALLLFGVLGVSLTTIRQRLSPFGTTFDTAGWVTLRRWIRAIEEDRLFGVIRTSPPSSTARQRAARAAMTLIAMAPPSLRRRGDEAEVIAGAERAA